jgi:transcriptional regulator, ArsR family
MGFAETFKALSDPIRREILMMLRDGSMSAGEIGSHFGYDRCNHFLSFEDS